MPLMIGKRAIHCSGVHASSARHSRSALSIGKLCPLARIARRQCVSELLVSERLRLLQALDARRADDEGRYRIGLTLILLPATPEALTHVPKLAHGINNVKGNDNRGSGRPSPLLA